MSHQLTKAEARRGGLLFRGTLQEILLIRISITET